MWLNSQETAHLVTVAEEILNEKLHFLCNAVFCFWQLNIFGQKHYEKDLHFWMVYNAWYLALEKLPYRKKKSRHKKVGKKFRHWQNISSLFYRQIFLPGYLETSIKLKKNINLLPWSLISFKSFNRI